MPNRINVPTPPANAARSTLQVVSWTASSDQYALVLDLNDGASWNIVPGTFTLGTPEKKYVENDNIRAPGTAVVKQQYGNMKVSATFTLRGSSVADIIATVRALVTAIDNPKQTPYALRIALPQATRYSYAWVLKCKHDVPLGNTRALIQRALTGITVVWDCAPGYLGDRLTLQNLAVNPGFEAPMGGGTAQSAPQVFSDPVANFNAYTVQAGGALAQDTFRYTDAVQSDGPRRYLRLGETSGTTAFEMVGGNNGTIAGGVTLGAAGAITGSVDTAYTFNGSTGKVTVPTALLPTGNQAISMECWFKFAANPAGAQMVMGYGDPAHGTRGFLEFQLQTTGAIIFNCGANNVSSAAGLATGVYHHLLGTYDGTTMTFYVDGASVGTPQTPAGGLVIPAAPALILGCSLSSANFFSGQVDEVAIYGSALAAARAAAHHTVGTTTPAATANTLVIPAGGRVSFGSTVWSALQAWQVRFRFLSGGTFSFYLHYTDASNHLQAQVTATQLQIIHTVGGVAHTQATATFSITLATEAQFWIKVTQFPTVPAGGDSIGDPPYLTAALFADSGGAMASTYATISAPASDAVTAQSGAPQIAASGAALGIGGAFTNVNAVWLWGPGGWFVQNSGTGTGTAAGAWERDTTQTYPSGPVTSAGAARLDAAPAGTLSALWTQYAGGTPGASGTNAIGISVLHQPSFLSASAWVKTSGLGGTAQLNLNLAEYDVNGALITTTTIATLTGNQASWTQLSASLLTNVSTRYVALQLAASDATAASAGATIWFDNAQVWDEGSSAQDSMPYCELRFPNSPATLVVSGLEGDIAAPAWLAAGTYLVSWPQGGTLGLALGRRPRADANAILASSCNGFYGTALSPQATAALDATAYGGFVPVVTLTSAGWNPRAFSPLAGDEPGVYHLLSRVVSGQSSGNLANQSVRVATFQQYSPWYGLFNQADILSAFYGPFLTNPLAPGGNYQVVDAGLCPLPPFPMGGLEDPTQTYVTPRQQWGDSSGTSALARANWNLLLPVDGSLLLATLNNPSNSPGALTSTWLWVYADPFAGGGGPVPQGVAWQYSQANAPFGGGPFPQPNYAAGSVGTQTTGQINVNPAADPYLTLDPALDTGTAAARLGVNQFGAVLYDQVASVLPLLAELQYTPVYLYPR